MILTEKEIKLINRIPLFRGFSKDQQSNLLEELEYETIVLNKGDIIIRQGTICASLNILLEGKLEVNIVDFSGNNFKVEEIIAPRAFATPHLFNDNNIYPATFTVVEKGLLVKASKDSVFRLISSIPELLRNFLHVNGNCNSCTVARLRILSYKSIRSRFISYLFEHKQNSNTVIMQHNQTQLAEYIGMTRPALANEISKMEKEELICVSGTRVDLIDINSLMRYM